MRELKLDEPLTKKEFSRTCNSWTAFGEDERVGVDLSWDPELGEFAWLYLYRHHMTGWAYLTRHKRGEEAEKIQRRYSDWISEFVRKEKGNDRGGTCKT